MEENLTKEMLAALFEKAKADGKEFPVMLHLTVEGKVITGYLYTDGTFKEGKITPPVGQMGSESEAGNSTVSA